MKLGFFHDHIFLKPNNSGYFSNGGFTGKSWERYLNVVDEVLVTARVESSITHDMTKLVPAKYECQQKVQFSLINVNQYKLTYSSFVSESVKNNVGNVDVVVARLPSRLGLLALKEAKKQRKKTAVEVVGCAWDAYFNYGKLRATLYAPIAYLKMRAAVKAADQVLYVTKHFLQNRYPTSKYCVNASNIELFNYKSPVFKVSENEIVNIGLIGNYKTNYKGIDVAIKALSKAIKDSGRDFRLRILGMGNKEIYEALASELNVREKVIFDGTRAMGSGVYEWLDEKIDIYIQPSRQEGLPRSLIEAMSRGLICAGSNAGGIPELLDERLIHKVGDSNKLASDIIFIDSLNREKKIELATRNFNESKSYTPEKIKAVRQEFYAKLVGGI